MQHNNTPGGGTVILCKRLSFFIYGKTIPTMAGKSGFYSGQEPMKQPMSMNIPYVTV